MDSYPLPKLLEEINQWITGSAFPGRIEIPWSVSQFEAVVNYFSKLEGQSDFSSRMYRKLCLHEDWEYRFVPEYHRKCGDMVVGFVQELGGLFKVPKPHQLSQMDIHFKRNELVAGFIGFLLQLLHLVPYDNASARFVPLMEDLRFLVMVLGDTPLEATDHEQVEALLGEFEDVANEAGTLVHSLVFVPHSLLTLDPALDALLGRIRVLKANIGRFLNTLPNIVAAPSQNYGLDSLYIVDSLLQDLKDIIDRDDNLAVDIMDQMEKLSQLLQSSQSFLRDTSMPRQPLMQIIDAAYEGEYLINSFMVGDAPPWYLTIRLTRLLHEIKLFFSKLQEGRTNYDIGPLNLAEDQLNTQSPPHEKKYFGVNDDVIVGLENKEMEILDQLVGAAQHLQIISICGMPGLGKTTLARKLYSHALIRYHFDKSCLCVVSQIYQLRNLLSNMLMSLRSYLGKATIFNMDEQSLGLEIYKYLKGRRYLIILDDIWNSDVWYDLRRFFPDEENGSRILFTSRDKDVAPGGTIINELSLLSDEQCWELLQKKVFGNKPCPQALQGAGQRIAKRCRGLPLAVVVIAGILGESMWEYVEERLESYMLSGENNPIIQILELSYKNLSEKLKPCFLYLGMFQEDEEIHTKKLAHLWIAEGFIHKEASKKAESVAEQYLMELIGKSLVTVTKRRSDGGAKVCAMHDLLRDMCLRISEKENFLKWVDHASLIWNQKYQRVRVRINRSYYPSSAYLVPYGPRTRSIYGSVPDMSLALHDMKLLRVMHFQARSGRLFGIDLLHHLRYLVVDLMVPSIDRLVNLEFLIVKYSADITSGILKMAKLKHLHFGKAIFANDCHVSEPNNLEFLSSVTVHNKKDEEILRYSPHLRRLKCKYRLSQDANEDYTYLDLHYLTQLESLSVEAELLNCRIAEIMLPHSIRKLSLSGFCLPWEKMSVIGALPYLEVLKLSFYAFEGEIWNTNDGEFEQLKFLKLDHLNFSEWNVDSQAFPRIQQLILEDCINLKQIPSEIGDIATLEMIELRGICPKSLVKSAQQILREQEDLENEHLKLHIQDIEHETDSDEERAHEDRSSPAAKLLSWITAWLLSYASLFILALC